MTHAAFDAPPCLGAGGGAAFSGNAWRIGGIGTDGGRRFRAGDPVPSHWYTVNQAGPGVRFGSLVFGLDCAVRSDEPTRRVVVAPELGVSCAMAVGFNVALGAAMLILRDSTGCEISFEPETTFTSENGTCYFTVQSDRAQRAAEEKSQKLLCAWLSAAQRLEFSERNGFTVRGEATGRRYLIRPWRSYNVYELDEGGEPVAALCFAPRGCRATGDIMLAQKIALECDERAALKVANRHAYAVAQPPSPADRARAAAAFWRRLFRRRA